MKKTYILTLAVIAFSALAFTNHSGGIFKTNTGNINFYSHTPIEDITADNHKVKTAFDGTSGKIQFSALIKDFEFPKAAMQEHFNENYMESTKYPKATFSGMIDDIDAVKTGENGTYTSTVTGKLTIKDVTKEVSTEGTFTTKNGVINGKTTFVVDPADYNIEIPKTVAGKISKEIKITVDADYRHAH